MVYKHRKQIRAQPHEIRANGQISEIIGRPILCFGRPKLSGVAEIQFVKIQKIANKFQKNIKAFLTCLYP